MISNRTNMRWRGRQMDERNARQMGVHDLVHLGVGTDLEEMRELILNVDQWPASRNLQHQSGVAEERAVANRRDKGVLSALDHFETNGATAEPRAQEVLNIADQRREDVFEIVLIVGWVISRAPF